MCAAAAGEDRGRVVGQVGDPVRLVRHGRAAGAARVERDRPEPLRENGDLLAPRPHALAEPLDEQQRLAVAVFFDVSFDLQSRTVRNYRGALPRRQSRDRHRRRPRHRPRARARAGAGRRGGRRQRPRRDARRRGRRRDAGPAGRRRDRGARRPGGRERRRRRRLGESEAMVRQAVESSAASTSSSTTPASRATGCS